MYVEMSVSVVLLLVALFSTLYYFLKRSREERPTFVSVQLILMLCFTIFNLWEVCQYTVQIEKGGSSEIDEPNFTENLLATLGDLVYIVHDWIFTD